MATKSQNLEVDTEAETQSEVPAQAPPIPNPPGGGKWVWDGAAWQTNTGAPAAE